MPKTRSKSRSKSNANNSARDSKGGAGGRTSVLHRPHLDKAVQRVQHGTDDVTIGGEGECLDKITTATMAQVADLIASVKYLVTGWIPFGMVTGFIAEPGVGKSAFALWLARSIMMGEPWFTGANGPDPGYVLWCPTENDNAITVDRMKKGGIPFDNLLLPFGDDPLASVDLLNAQHLKRIERLICKYKPKAMFVDSLRGSHDGDENSSRVGRVLKNLSGIAERTQAAVIVVHHTHKLMDGEEISANSSRGSNAILALFRAQLGFDMPDANGPCPKGCSPWVRVRMLKQNLGLAPQPIGMRVTGGTEGFALEFGDAPHRPDKDTQKAKATDWLRDHLKDGKWHTAIDVKDAYKQFGFSDNAIQRAREELGITTGSNLIRRREDGKYEWSLSGGKS